MNFIIDYLQMADNFCQIVTSKLDCNALLRIMYFPMEIKIAWIR